MRVPRGVALILALGLALPAAGQSTRNGPTLRHGSGLLDVPVASALPDGSLRFNYSSFLLDVAGSTEIYTGGTVLGAALIDPLSPAGRGTVVRLSLRERPRAARGRGYEMTERSEAQS